MLEPKEMAARIKAAAKSNGIKLGDMWRDLGLSNNTLHNMNSGSTPSIGTLVLISQYLRVPPENITGEKITTSNKKSAPDSEIRDTIIEMLNNMDDRQLTRLQGYLEGLAAAEKE